METEFARRGWSWTCQSPQSPMANVLDAVLFPYMSKAVSHRQGLFEQHYEVSKWHIWTHARAVWNGLDTTVIARAFAGHHQVVSAIRAHDGTNDFLRENGGIHFGVRQHYITDNSGVEGVESHELIVDPDAAALKYSPPTMRDILRDDVAETGRAASGWAALRRAVHCGPGRRLLRDRQLASRIFAGWRGAVGCRRGDRDRRVRQDDDMVY